MAKSRGKKSAAYDALQRLMKEPGSLDDIWIEISRFDDSKSKLARVYAGREYDDLATAIVFGAMVEQAVETAVSRYFEIPGNIFSHADEGLISTFAAKISAGHALGIYCDRMRSDLTAIKNIRNAFAHSRTHVGFDTHAIVLNCDQLRVPPKEVLGIPDGVGKTPRQKFVVVAAALSTYLTTGPHPLKYQKSRVYGQCIHPDQKQQIRAGAALATRSNAHALIAFAKELRHDPRRGI